MPSPAALAGALLLTSFLPPLLFLLWIRHAERRRREPWRLLFRHFLWGATAAVALSLMLEGLAATFLSGASFVGLPVTVVVVAPLVEEIAKGLGLRPERDGHREPEDGLIHGAAAGLGFAAVENVLYVGMSLVFAGIEVAAWTALLRGVGAVSLHASASALVGRAAWAGRWVAGLAPAILLHAGYNALASLQMVGAALAAVVLAFLVLRRVRAQVRALDAA